MKRDFYKLIEKFALEMPNKTLLTIDENELTYQEFIDKTKIISKGLCRYGIKKNSKVGLILSNSIEWYELFWAAVRIGAQPVPIDPQSGAMELDRLLEFADLELCFLSEFYRNNRIYEILKPIAKSKEKIRKFILLAKDEDTVQDNFITFDTFYAEAELEDSEIYYVPEEEHIMSLACTSGSTGVPKVLSVPYCGFYDAIVDMGNYLNFTKDDVMMIGMPMYHQGGFGMGLQTVVKGGSVIYQPQFNPIQFLETVQKKKVSIIQLTSTLAKIILSTPNFDSYDLSSVRVCYFAGEVLPRNIAEYLVEKMGIRVINVIGSSETATMVVWDSDRDYGVDPSDFQELPFTKVNIVDEHGNNADYGELMIYTTAVIANYYANEEETKNKVVLDENGKRCFMTGDLVKRLDDGRIRFMGRNKRIIKRGGNLVYAEEVEAFLLSHPDIVAVAVVEKEHPVFGQQIVAFIQTKEQKVLTRGDIAVFFNGKMSAYKIPDQIICTEELPHDIGKIQFKYIREKN